MGARHVDVGDGDVVARLAAERDAGACQVDGAVGGRVDQAGAGGLLRLSGLLARHAGAGEHHGVGSLLGCRLLRHGLGSRSGSGSLTCGVAGSGCCRGGAGGIGVELIHRTGRGLLRRSVIGSGSGLVPRLPRGSLIALGLPAVSGGHLLIALVAVLVVLVVLTVLIVLVILVVLVKALVGYGCACAAELLRRVCGGCAVAGVRPAQAVAFHLLVAQLGDDGRGDGFGDDVELAVLEALVHDEAHERLAVHGQALLGGLRG